MKTDYLSSISLITLLSLSLSHPPSLFISCDTSRSLSWIPSLQIIQCVFPFSFVHSLSLVRLLSFSLSLVPLLSIPSSFMFLHFFSLFSLSCLQSLLWIQSFSSLSYSFTPSFSLPRPHHTLIHPLTFINSFFLSHSPTLDLSPLVLCPSTFLLSLLTITPCRSAQCFCSWNDRIC